MSDELKIRIHGEASLPALVYLPGMHGDWTLVSSFRAAVAGQVRFVEFAYPRTTTWSLDDYARAVEEQLVANGIQRGWLLGESFGSQPAWQLIGRFLMRHDPGNEIKRIPHPSPEERKASDTPPPQSLPMNGPVPDPSQEGSRPSSASCQVPSWEGLGVGLLSQCVIEKPLVGMDSKEVGPSVHAPQARTDFCPLGLILAGGFVRHPVNWAVRMAGRASGAMPLGWVRLFCAAYARYAQFRHRRAPETLASIAAFVANRTIEADRRAIVHRYGIIADNDLRPVARQTELPVYYLAGLVDPLVPWFFVRWWLRRHCRGYRGGTMIWRADHNVLGTAPIASRERILRWMNSG